jgi:lipoprotein-releasing system permease protein|tara:strand:- start:8619 stop:9857 length:1239 start_codon:yes stop_codon:yes gene_type:complete
MFVVIMNLSYYISNRLFFTKKGNNRYTKPILLIGTLAVTLSVTVMLLSIMISTGFKNQITEKIIGFAGDITITSYVNNQSYESVPINKNQSLIYDLQSNKNIVNVSSFATKAGILKNENEILGVVLKGVSSDYNWDFFKKNMVSGNTLTLSDSISSNNIIISKQVAKNLNLSLGESVFMYFAQDPPRVRKFLIHGIFSTALSDFDDLFVIADIKQIQKLNNWQTSQIGGLEIKINDFRKLDEVAEFVYNKTDYNLKSESIKERFPQLFDWLDLQNMNVFLIIVLMVIVALVNMITVLIIIILEKVQLVGILKSMGLSNWNVRKIFLYQSIKIATLGLILGNLLAFILTFLQKRFQFLKLDSSIYYMQYIPVDYDFFSVLIINIVTIVICYLALIIPSAIITKMKLINSIRFE